MRRSLLKWALIGGGIMFLYMGVLKVPKYKVEATFKEEADKGVGDGSLRELLGGVGIGASSQPEVATIMKSYQLLKPLAEKLGLQASISGHSKWIVGKVLKRLRESFLAARGVLLKDVDPFVFENVFYEGADPLLYTICFTDPTHFTVFSSNKKRELGKSELGIATQIDGVNFTILKTPEVLKIGKFYDLKIHSWVSAAKFLRDQLKVESDKNNKSIFHLSALVRDRCFGQRFINELMAQYQNYLKKEHDQITEEQIGYLENKQRQIYEQMDKVFDEHVSYLSQNLEKNGLGSMMEQSESLSIHHQKIVDKILAIEMDLSRIKQLANGEWSSITLTQEGQCRNEISKISAQLHDLKSQRDLFEVSLCKNLECSIEGKKEELNEIRAQRYTVEQLAQKLKIGDQISALDSGLAPSLYHWAQNIQNVEEKNDLLDYLGNYNRLLCIREKTLQESSFSSAQVPLELQSIDLPTARAFFIEYNSKLDAIEGSMRLYAQFQKEIQQPDFEIGSLNSILTDPFSQKLIAEASEVGVRLKNEKYHSSREGERWREDIELHKKILTDHLGHLYRASFLNATLIKEKIVSLQKVCVDCINQQISLLNQQAEDQIKESTFNLIQERNLLEEKVKEIKVLSKDLPEKWRLEKWLELKTDMVTTMMEAITQVVESKTISHHLHRVGSRPLDLALLPLSTEPPRLLLFTFLGGFLSSFALFFFTLVRQILKGFPISFEKLQALRLPVLGSISSFCDGPLVEIPKGPDLELLRSLALFSKNGKVTGLVNGDGPDYSYALCENLARMSIRSIVLRCDFLSKFQKDDCPGILQVVEGNCEELPIRKGKGFDYITSGGYSPFGTEIIQSEKFQKIVGELKEKYDRVFILTRTPISSAESIAVLGYCEKAVVTVSQEKVEELIPFINWGFDENPNRLTFITQL